MVEQAPVARVTRIGLVWNMAKSYALPALLLVPVILPPILIVFVWLDYHKFAFIPLKYIGIGAHLLLADIELFKDVKIVPELVPPVIAIVLIAVGRLQVNEKQRLPALVGYGLSLYLSLAAFTIFLESNAEIAEGIVGKLELQTKVLPGLTGLVKVLRLVALSCVALTIQRLLPPRQG